MTTATTATTDSASSGTPDTHPMTVNAGDRVRATRSAHANEPVLLMTAVTADIGFYQRSTAHSDRGFR